MHGNQFIGALLPQILVHAPLHDAEQRLIRPLSVIHATPSPKAGQLNGLQDIIIFSGVRRTFIKRHNNVRAQGFLNIYGFLRADEVF